MASPTATVISPQPGPQTQYLSCAADLVVYGGSAGGGKTWALLLDALRFAALHPVPEFVATIFRRTSPQITQPGGLWDESGKLYPLAGGIPKRSPVLQWSWPAHRTRITFAHMQYDADRFNYQGAQIPLICFDELTHFSEEMFFYMLSRNRSMCGVKPRMRATTNPDADSWVKRFLAPWVDELWPESDRAASGEVRYMTREGGTIQWYRSRAAVPDAIRAHAKSVTFIAASIEDNPKLLAADPGYLANLMALPLVERQRLRYGDWAIRPSGNLFKRHWFTITDAVPAHFERIVRYWDLAATEPKPGKDPDWTAGVKIGKTKDGVYYVLDVIHERLSPKGVQNLIQKTTEADGRGVHSMMEQEPGAMGKSLVDHYRTLLAGYPFRAIRPTGDKALRAHPASSQAEGGNVFLVRGPWNDAFLNELVAFPTPDVHDDQVDAFDGAMTELMGKFSMGQLAQHIQGRLAPQTVPAQDDWY